MAERHPAARQFFQWLSVTPRLASSSNGWASPRGSPVLPMAERHPAARQFFQWAWFHSPVTRGWASPRSTRQFFQWLSVTPTRQLFWWASFHSPVTSGELYCSTHHFCLWWTSSYSSFLLVSFIPLTCFSGELYCSTHHFCLWWASSCSPFLLVSFFPLTCSSGELYCSTHHFCFWWSLLLLTISSGELHSTHLFFWWALLFHSPFLPLVSFLLLTINFFWWASFHSPSLLVSFILLTISSANELYPIYHLRSRWAIIPLTILSAIDGAASSLVYSLFLFPVNFIPLTGGNCTSEAETVSHSPSLSDVERGWSWLLTISSGARWSFIPV